VSGTVIVHSFSVDLIRSVHGSDANIRVQNSFSSVAYPEKMLDLASSGSENGTLIIVWTGEGKTNQRWKLLPS
jgi:hypothetical protein